jgi:hypothetical protein
VLRYNLLPACFSGRECKFRWGNRLVVSIAPATPATRMCNTVNLPTSFESGPVDRTRCGWPLPKALQGLQSYKLLLVFEVKLPISRGSLFAAFAKTILADGIICLSACAIATRSGEGDDLHHHGHLFQLVLDSRKLANPTSWLGQRFPFLFAGAVAKAALAATNKTVYTASPNLKTHLDIKRSFLLANSFSIMRLFNSIASAQLAPEEYAFSVVENTEFGGTDFSGRRLQES